MAAQTRLQAHVPQAAQMRALTRVAKPENEEMLVDFALAGTAAHVEQLVRAWRQVDRLELMDDKDAIHHHHHLQTYFDEDGMLVVRGRLSPEVGDLLRKALDAAMEELYKQPHEEGGTYVSAETSRRIGCESGKMVMTHAGDSSSRTPSPLSSA